MPSKINLILNDFVALFFPNICIGCKGPLPNGLKHICTGCQYELPKTNNYKEEVPHIYQKLAGSIRFNHMLAYLHFQKKGIVQHILHELKYNHNEDVGLMMGRWYGHDLLLGGFSNEFDLIIPVPLHPSKQRKRGYNQSEAFANGLSEVLKVEVCIGLRRVTASETQTRKSRAERLENVKAIFEAVDPVELKKKRVLLVDDVITTGATLLACGNVLIDAGVEELSFGVLASTY
ncbi:ComF family protein [Roseivirga sp.]|uniref:ComF family protein n=1 Tax=Roseivirga sp. TaxID=1964215 RepID=UPI002B271C89|nr:ComF family protein [Roseivirga sp.]